MPPNFWGKVQFFDFQSFGIENPSISLHFKNENCTIDKMNFSSHLLARFPGDYEDLSIHTAGSLVEVPMIRTMAAKTVADSRDCESTIPTRRSAVAADSARQFERLQSLPAVLAAAAVPELAGAPAGSDCGATAAFQCNSDRGSDDGVR